MQKKKVFRFDDVLAGIGLHKTKISFDKLVETTSKSTVKSDPSGMEKLSIFVPFMIAKVMEQIKIIIPIGLYLVLFQALILRQPLLQMDSITLGFLAIIVGLYLFMQGLEHGLMPLSEIIGNRLPKTQPQWVVLLIVYLIGIATTFAEPAIGSLQLIGSFVDPKVAPYLSTILRDHALALSLTVGVGVGFAASLGTIRFVKGWSLKPLIYITFIPLMILTIYAMNSDMRNIYSLAWDCGAVTTGPVTVPIVLALGVGIASASGEGENSLSGFGIVTLASLFPIIAVLLLCMYMIPSIDPVAVANVTNTAAAVPAWWEESPYSDTIMGLRAVIPLVIFLLLIFFALTKSKLKSKQILAYGLFHAFTGMVVFNLGLRYGLTELGNQTGGTVPAAFAQLDSIQGSPLFSSFPFGVGVALCFIFILGYGATLAEPALNALGRTVEILTNGVMRKKALMFAVAMGVAMGLTLGIAKLIFKVNLGTLIIPLYAVALILTYFSSEEFVNVAWDSAGVTTGPITVPLVMAAGIGFSTSVNAIQGFGILALASVCPIVSVLATGLYAKYKASKEANS